MNYSQEFKDAMLRRMLPPNNESITKISREEGISEQTLRNRRDQARRPPQNSWKRSLSCGIRKSARSLAACTARSARNAVWRIRDG